MGLGVSQHNPLQRSRWEQGKLLTASRGQGCSREELTAGGNLQSEHESLFQPRQMISALHCFSLSLGVDASTQICPAQSSLPLKA